MFAMKVWIYSGQTISELYSELFTVPSILVIQEHETGYSATFMISFQGQWITLKDQFPKKSRQHYSGVTTDSRGFDVEWSMRMVGKTITGFYQMDYDRGRIELNLVSMKKSLPVQRQLALAAI